MPRVHQKSIPLYLIIYIFLVPLRHRFKINYFIVTGINEHRKGN